MSLVTRGFQSSRPISSINIPRSDLKYGRVLDVILDETHPLWDALGRSQSQYGIFYQPIGVGATVDNVSDKNFAYCKLGSFRRIPIKNEIVSLESSFGVEKAEHIKGTSREKIYWVDIVSLWNHPHLNVYPDTIQFGEGAADTGKDFKEVDNINPLQLHPGDMSIEGRHGNSIRLGGTSYNSQGISKENGSPYIIIRNGQGVKESSGDKAIYEDIDKDSSSIYLTSNHSVPLTQANDKRNAWKSAKGPEKAKDFKGAQIVANSDRIYLNARSRDIELSSKEGTGINAKMISLDGKDYVAFDADKIYLGEGAFKESEPVLLGKSTVNWLTSFCTYLDTLLTVMGTTMTPAQLPAMAAAANITKGQITEAKTILPTLGSKKSFVE